MSKETQEAKKKIEDHLIFHAKKVQSDIRANKRQINELAEHQKVLKKEIAIYYQMLRDYRKLILKRETKK